MQVAAAEAAYEPWRRIELLAKVAARDQREVRAALPALDSRTTLAILRCNVRAWDPVLVGVELRDLREHENDDERSGFLGELMWDVKKHFRLGVGYNFTDFSDDEFAEDDRSVGGWFLRVQGRY
jgi:hypothetical protein